jgi:hypothetical protein
VADLARDGLHQLRPYILSQLLLCFGVLLERAHLPFVQKDLPAHRLQCTLSTCRLALFACLLGSYATGLEGESASSYSTLYVSFALLYMRSFTNSGTFIGFEDSLVVLER